MAIHEWIVTGSISERILKQRGYKELVRCKDCKHLGYTNSHWFCKWLNRCVDEYWFCADGERR